jgi:uncharacterized membrane protein YhiD involved in acid resistance
MAPFSELLDHLFDIFVLGGGLVVIAWLGLHSFQRAQGVGLRTGAVVGILACLAVFASALYLIFG